MRAANIARYRFSPSAYCGTTRSLAVRCPVGCSAGSKDKNGGITRGGSDSLDLGGSNSGASSAKGSSDGGLVLPVGGDSGLGSRQDRARAPAGAARFPIAPGGTRPRYAPPSTTLPA